MNKKRILRCILFAALMIGLVPAAMMAAEGDPSIQVNGEVVTDTNITINSGDDNTITITGDVTLTGSGDAFTIGADTNLVFEEGASLTLSGYTNGFVVENATVSSANMDIVAQSQMDVFRLKNSGKLDLTGDNSIYGSGKTGTTNRAIVLPGSTSGQAVTLAADSTLAANNFYRAIETGGASGYTISGSNRDTSVFDFSDNECGMFISYFDTNVNFKDCKLEVSDCLTSGIFMRQDNAALDGLYIDNVFINCVNETVDEQADLAIRFHSNNFEITDSVINIDHAWNTGLWICDGWNANEQNEITDTVITVKNVEPSPNTELYGAAVRKKAITFVPFRDWLISGCDITMEGTDEELLQGGLNIASDMRIVRNGLSFTAKPGMYGGTIKLEDTHISTSNIQVSDIGVQLGQFLEIGSDVVIDNDYQAPAGWNDKTEHYTVLCDTVKDGFAAQILGQNISITYDVSDMNELTKADQRVTVSGGSYYMTDNDNLRVYGRLIDQINRTPINEDGVSLVMVTLTQDEYDEYVTADGNLLLTTADGQEYSYTASNPSADGNRYIWVPETFANALSD